MSVESIIEERQAELGHMKPLYKQEVIEVDVASLKHHPLNEALYGTHIDPEFVENIRQHGVQEPITICRSTEEAIDGVVAKGRRRCLAASTLGITRIKAVEWYCESEDEFRKQLILSNVHNEQPLDHRVRMYTELKAIEERAAASRQRKGAPSEDSGRSSDLAAAKVGISRSTAMRAEKVLAAADAMKESGNTEEAQKIVETLNKRGATAAAKVVAETVETPTPSLGLTPVVPSVLENQRSLDRAVSSLKTAIKTAYAAYGAVVRSADAVKVDNPKAFKAGHKQVEDKCRMIESYLSNATAAADVIGDQWSASKKAIAKAVIPAEAAVTGTTPPDEEAAEQAIGFEPGETHPF